ncbi:MAG: response regulator [Candidatus Paceibacterota bacterium]|jgi:CheY-like chemotaxis protein|nr:response regulator [Candidatus Paceibacterota bacterium]MDD4830605.1 response regulator [Candidatus Paceibacterota bacterium]MDD4874926.1 response regulator [Candidatus Paceibacterota bacterium]
MPHKILLVEDDRFLRELMSQKIIKMGDDLTVAVDGEEGVVKAKEVKPEIILLDLMLPGIDGFGVLSQIKADPETAEIPVIILSNLGQREDIDRALKLGATDFLVKAHFTPQEIIDKIDQYLK